MKCDPLRRPDRSANVAMPDGKWKLLVNADGAGAECRGSLPTLPK